MGYTKLDENLVTSSIWSEDDKTLRVWCYLMARADSTGWVLETIPAIARACNYDIPTIEAILAKFAGPDKYSRTKDHEGRRIAILHEPEFGIYLLNHPKYRAKDHTAAERQRRHRASNVTAVTRDKRDVTPKTVTVTQAEAETEPEPTEKAAGRAAPPNPLVDRDRLVAEGYDLVTAIAPLENLDPTEVLNKASEWRGRGYVRLDSMSEDRLAHTLNALRRWHRRITGQSSRPSRPPGRRPP